MKKPIATPSRTKEILETHGMFAKKNYGQNFLIESGIVDKIARHAVLSDHCVVFEIGPGIGALTQYLCEYAKKVVSFEIDERLPAVLADTLQEYENFELVMRDFLEIDLNEWCRTYREEGYDVVIAANLPYYITTPILFKIFESKADVAAITVMMQKEVADRFAAEVNTKDYNALSIITQYRCEVAPVMKVPKMFSCQSQMWTVLSCSSALRIHRRILRRKAFSTGQGMLSPEEKDHTEQLRGILSG